MIIYTAIFLFLAIGMHFKQWMDHPVEHVINLPHGGAFGVPGMAHPFVFTLIVYLIISIPRWLFSKKKVEEV